MTILAILIFYVFINNWILVKFLGLCPFIGVSKNSENAIGMGMALTFVTAITSVLTWAVYLVFSFRSTLSIWKRWPSSSSLRRPCNSSRWSSGR